MSITTAVTGTHLTRSALWSTQLKEILRDELTGQGYVRWMTEFPDGDAFNIPSIGDSTVRDYVENTPVTYDSLDTGNYQFTLSEYESSATYITKKARQDAFYAAQLEASFVPKQARAMMESLETKIFGIADVHSPSGGHQQTANDLNVINGANHRWAGSGSVTANNGDMAVNDFAKALYSLKKANVPDSNLIAIVDPSVEYMINILTDLSSMANPSPRWDGIVESGIGSGMRFIKNIFGFDIYVSNYLSTTSTDESDELEQTGATITDNSTVGYVNNIFFSAASPDILPFVGAWRQMPEVDSEYNKDFQREEYLTTSRYGLDLYRPENLVTVITNPATE